MKFIDGYYAKDSNGDAYFYDELPVKGKRCWHYNKPTRLLYCVQIDGPWEDSLHRVEGGKITKVQIYSKDQKVLVSFDGEVWHRRYYSHYKDGNHYVFSNGATSWSQGGHSNFNYIKPAEEE